jgi:hypothetical protein
MRSKGDIPELAQLVIVVWEQVYWTSGKAAFDRIGEKVNNAFDVRYTS